METFRVFILFRHSLFAEAIHNLLAGVQGIEVVGTDTDPEHAMQSIQALEPDVVVLETDDDLGVPGDITPVFWKKRGPKLIGVKLNSNEMTIYQKRRRIVIRREDLIEAIQNKT